MKSIVFQIVLGFLLSILIFLGMLSGAIQKTSSNQEYYFEKFEENNISQVTGKTKAELNHIGKDLIKYLKTGENNLLEKYFNQREILHMEDVYQLMVLNKMIWYIFLIFIIPGFYVFYRLGGTWKELFVSNLFLLFLLLLFFGIISLNFSKAFIIFHKIFFQNDLWILNPETDLMIQMLPENFFEGMAKKIGILVLLGQLIYMIILSLGKAGFFGKNSLYRRFL
ncbi:MAG: TIGR01906 family membrane protein [Tissierellia bacterium]|nr:TIGR01906 family membrane protein [Tissierellia bacterium]